MIGFRDVPLAFHTDLNRRRGSRREACGSGRDRTEVAGPRLDTSANERGHQKPIGEWNEQEVTAKGRQITVKLNGQTIVDANLDDVKAEAVLKKHPGLAKKTGHIGFLGHGAHVEFRNLRIKELPAK